jgi:hypothetical protein
VGEGRGEIAGPLEEPDPGVDVPELGVAVAMLAALDGLDVCLQRVAEIVQTPGDRGGGQRFLTVN